MIECNEIDFTDSAENVFFDIVDNDYFRNKDAELIYDSLRKRLSVIPFCNYLKRYIYIKAELSGDYKNISLNDYRRIIRDSFEDNNTPPSFTPTTTRLNALSKNWLTQMSVSRQVVLLLGFGLKMSVEDVSAFLIKALRERDINLKNPHELICWYCYKNQYSYPKYIQLRNSFDAMSPNNLDMQLIYAERTIGVRDSAAKLNDDASLLAKLSKMKTNNNITYFSISARLQFERLYSEARKIIAGFYNQSENERTERRIEEYVSKAEFNGNISDEVKNAQIQKMRNERKFFLYENITESDMEKVLCSAVPVDRYGNLSKGNASKLNDQFTGKRFSRQRIFGIINNNIEIDRFDLITLNFFIYSQKVDDIPNPKTRYLAFVDDMNAILNDCSMGELLISNPYECFVLMCILCDDPLGTYADVWELSYTEQEDNIL